MPPLIPDAILGKVTPYIVCTLLDRIEKTLAWQVLLHADPRSILMVRIIATTKDETQLTVIIGIIDLKLKTPSWISIPCWHGEKVGAIRLRTIHIAPIKDRGLISYHHAIAAPWRSSGAIIEIVTVDKICRDHMREEEQRKKRQGDVPYPYHYGYCCRGGI